MVADNLGITASSRLEMQEALLTAQVDASRERYLYNSDKTKTLVINGKQENEPFILHGKLLGISMKEKHLGIIRNCKNT